MYCLILVYTGVYWGIARALKGGGILVRWVLRSLGMGALGGIPGGVEAGSQVGTSAYCLILVYTGRLKRMGKGVLVKWVLQSSEVRALGGIPRGVEGGCQVGTSAYCLILVYTGLYWGILGYTGRLTQMVGWVLVVSVLCSLGIGTPGGPW